MIGRLTIHLLEPLTDTERSRVRLDLQGTLRELEAEEAQYAEAQARIKRRRKNLGDEQRRLAGILADDAAPSGIPGHVRRTQEDGVVEVVRDDTGVVVVTRPATPAELQDPIPGAEPRLPDEHVKKGD